MNQTQSRTIDILRFPLIVLIVFIHTPRNVTFGSGIECSVWEKIASSLELFLSCVFPRISVPLFFLISGYLFFIKLEDWNWTVYSRKLATRFQTLLVPYLLWNTLSFFCISIFSKLEFLYEKKISYSLICEFSKKIFDALWCNESLVSLHTNWIGNHTVDFFPLIVPLWFIRDLICVITFSPIIYFYVNKTKLWGISVLLLFFISGIWPSSCKISITTVLFFCLGAYISITKKSIVDISKKIKTITIPISIISLIVCVYYHGYETLVGTRIMPIYIINGVWSFFYIFSKIVEKYNLTPCPFLVHSCLFVSALHLAPVKDTPVNLLSVVCSFLNKLSQDCVWTSFMYYLLSPIFSIIICLIIFCICNQYFPSFCRILTGNRV